MAAELELERGRELFKALLRNEGYEATLVPFLERYRKEDNKEYSFSTILKYIQIYAKSEYVTKEEIQRYNKLRSVSKSTLLKRGKEICDTLMENKFLSVSIEPLGAKYAEEDKRYLPYSKPLLDRMRKSFLEIASKEYIEKYNEALELAKRSTTEGFDFDTLRQIVNSKSPDEALNYLTDHGINYESLRGLRNAYFQVYPDDLFTRVSIDSIEALMLSERNKIIQEKNRESLIMKNAKKHQEKIERLKRILTNYINSGKDNLEECIKEEGTTTRYFFETLTDELKSDNQEIKELHQKYMDVDASFSKSRRELAKTLEDYYDNGVYYGQENRKFSLYDFYVLTDKSIEEIRKILRAYLPVGKAVKIGTFVGNLIITSKFSDRNSFLDQLKYLYPNIDTRERDAIIDYMEDEKWPYSVTLFKDIWVRLADGLIVLPETRKKSAKNMNK